MTSRKWAPIAGVAVKGATRQRRASSRLGVEELEDGAEGGDLALGPVLARVGRGGGDQAAEVVGDGVEGGEVGLLLVGEVGVEDPVGDGRGLGDLGDRGGGVAALGDQRRNRGKEALALGLGDLLAGKAVVAAGKRAQITLVICRSPSSPLGTAKGYRRW